MKKAITTVHTIIVILGLLSTAGWSVYYLYNQRQFNSETNAARIPGLVKEVTSAMDSSQSLYDKGFGEDIKKIFSVNQDIIALSIYSYDTGIEYFYSKNGQIGIKNNDSQNLNQTPVYSGLSFSNSIGSTPLYLKEKPGTNIDFIFNVLPRSSVFYVLKISLLAVIVLFVITLFLIVAFSLSKGKKSVEGESEWDNQEDFDDPDSSQEYNRTIEDDSLEANSFDDLDHQDSDDLGFEMSDDTHDSVSDDLDFEMPDDTHDSVSDDLDFEIPDDNHGSESDDFGLDDSLNLDDLDMEDGLSEEFNDNLNLEDSIPDIPDTEDLLGMDHEEMSDSGDQEDFNFPQEEDLFDEMSSDDLGLDELNSKDEDPSAPTLYNPDTGLGWESFLEERLGLELERSASFDQDLVLVMISNDLESNVEMEKISAIVKDVYSYQDLIFEAGKNGLALIEPNKDLDEAIMDVQNLFKRMEQEMDITGLKCGLSSRNGRLITGKRLIKEADTSLNKSDEENPIVGFRSDPERFREYLSHSS